MPNVDIDAFYCSAYLAIVLCFIELSRVGLIALTPRKNFAFYFISFCCKNNPYPSKTS